MELNFGILRRCKQVIEQLQMDLSKKTLEIQQKEHLIQNIINQRNHLINKNLHLQKIVLQIKQQNTILKNKLIETQSSYHLENEVQTLYSDLRKAESHLQDKQLEVRQLQIKLREQTKSNIDNYQELMTKIESKSQKIRMLEQELRIRDEEIQRQKILNDRKCESCEAISDVKTLATLRRKIDDNLRSNSKKSYQNSIYTQLFKQNQHKTSSTKRSSSLSKHASEKKSGGNIISNNKARLISSQQKNQIYISPFIINQRLNILNMRNDMMLAKKRHPMNQDTVNDTLKQIQNKLHKMSQKLAEEDSDMSIMITR